MTMAKSGDPALSLAAQIVIAYVEHNETPARTLPGLIRDVYQTLASVGSGTTAPYAQPVPRPPATRKAAAGQTVFDDHVVCLECRLHMKMLKRHLQTVHNLTPVEYRLKWQLPGDYPMVARDYAALRSNLAKES